MDEEEEWEQYELAAAEQYELEMEQELENERDTPKWNEPMSTNKISIAPKSPEQERNVAKELSNYDVGNSIDDQLTEFSTMPLHKSLQLERSAYLGIDKNNHHSSVKTSQYKAVTEEDLYRVPAAECKKSLHQKLPSDSQDYTSCTISSDRRYFVYKRPAKNMNELDNSSTKTDRSRHHFLDKPIEDIMKEAEQIQLNLSLQLKRKVATTEEMKHDPVSAAEVNDKERGRLWVDKYAPKSFSQLLSPEKINREVLKAMKGWDRYVFKTNSTDKTPTISSPKPTHKRKMDGEVPDEGIANDDDPRPLTKVIMLCGPPGTGKTTLAHIIAEQCGYQAVEINASDDRSPEYLREAISRASQNTTLSIDKRPNCIILDEIDGIDGSAKGGLHFLLNIITAPLKGPKGSGGDSKMFPLTRPLICICNDQFTPALRQLKQLCEVFQFESPKESRLIQRLRAVCASEKVPINSQSSVIKELCTATGGDIRSTFNVLQFSYGQPASSSSSSGDTTASSNNLQATMRNGVKDRHLSVFELWTELFTKQKKSSSSSYRGTNSGTSSSTSSSSFSSSCSSSSGSGGSSNLVGNAMELMSAHGDYARVIGGLFENLYRNAGTDHNNFHWQTQTSEWFSLVDNLQTFTFNGADGFMVQGYIPTIAAATQLFSAVDRKIKMIYPRKEQELSFQQKQKHHLFQLLVSEVTSGSFTSSHDRLSLDLTSYLLRLLNPPLPRMVHTKMSPSEEAAALRVVLLMESFALTYGPVPYSGHRNGDIATYGMRTPHDADYSSLLQLQPNIERLLEYGLQAASSVEQGSGGKYPYGTYRGGGNGHCEGGFSAGNTAYKQMIKMQQRKYQIAKKIQRIKDSLPAEAGSSVDKKKDNGNEKEMEIVQEKKQMTAEPVETAAVEQENPAKTAVAGVVGKTNLAITRIQSMRVYAGLESQKTGTAGKVDRNNKSNNRSNGQGQIESKHVPIHFKFVKGFSSAVRRGVTIDEFR